MEGMSNVDNSSPASYLDGSTSMASRRHDSIDLLRNDKQDRFRDVHANGNGHISSRRHSYSSSRSLSSDLELDDLRPPYIGDDEEVGLTAAIKAEAVQEPQRNSLIHEHRGSTDENDIWEEARRMGKQAFIRKVITNGILIGLWYVFSICISVYNKWMFSPGNLDFHFPMFTTSVHMIIQFCLSSIVLLLFPSLRPRQAAASKLAKDAASKKPPSYEPLDPTKPLMTPWFYFSRIASCGCVTGLDIGLGNTSLKYVTLTFFTMCKSSTLGFVLAFAILFRLEKPSWKVGGIILVMTTGVVMMVAGETAFDALGFVLLMMASFCSGLRWSLTQILLRRTPATSNPFLSLFFLTPVMFFTLFIIAIPAEGFHALGVGLDQLVAERGLALGIGIILFPGVLAFCMVSAEFALLQRTSVVTLSVCGIFKEVLTVTAAGIIFGDVLTPINVSGLIVTILAIVGYNAFKMQKMRKEEVKKAAANMEEHTIEMSTRLTTDDDAQGLLADDTLNPHARLPTSERLSNALPQRGSDQHDFETLNRRRLSR